jgi:polysaccharide biosynthesis transport protein
MLPGIKKRVVNFSDVMMYVAVGLKYGRLVVLIFCLSLLAGLTYYVYAKPVYYGRSVIQYSPVARPLDTETVFKDSNELAVMTELGSPHIVMRAARKMGFKGTDKELESEWIRKVKVSMDGQRNIMIEVWPYLAHLTAPWGETMFNEYLAAREERRQNYRESSIRTFTNDMNEISLKVAEVQASKAAFKETNEITQLLIKLNELSAVPIELVQLEQRITSWTKLKADLDNPGLDTASKLALLTAQKDGEGVHVGQVVRSLNPSQFDPPTVAGPLPSPLQGGKGPGVVVVPQMIEGGGEGKDWMVADRRRRQLLEEIKTAGERFLPAHPTMVKLNEKLAEEDKIIRAEYVAARNRFDLELARMTDRRAELGQKLPAYRDAMRDFERLQMRSAEYDAAQLPWTSMYGVLAKAVSTYHFGMDNERAQMVFLGNHELRDVVPVSPNRLKLILISLALGLSLAIGVPFLFEYLDYTVNDVAEVEDTLQLRGLGIVPRVLEGAAEKFPLLGTSEREARHLLENFRVIRTNLILTSPKAIGEGGEASDTRQQVIMVASAVPKEGKTAIAANLAISFAQKGEKTLLIDADLRRGRMHRLFGTRTSPGLSNIMVEGLKVENVIRPSFHDNLDLITCGKHISGATELLGSGAFAEFVKEIRGKYQKIVIDTPPVLGLSETSMMQTMVDGVLFVISADQTPMRSVKSAIELLRANKANFFGFVLNRIDLSNNANYYNYYYYSYHYYDRYQALEKAS